MTGESENFFDWPLHFKNASYGPDMYVLPSIPESTGYTGSGSGPIRIRIRRQPYQVKDIITLKDVQHRATKIITNDYISNYKSRLLQLHLLPLMYQYEIKDLLFLIKCQNQPDNINIHDHFNFVTLSARRNNHMLRYNYARTSITWHSFFNRVVRLWNALGGRLCKNYRNFELNILKIFTYIHRYLYIAICGYLLYICGYYYISMDIY